MSTESNTGRVAVVTGASSGIGEAAAGALVADGYRVALLARRADRIQALADELGDGVIAIEADVTDRDSLVAAARRVEDELGGADVLINNAGVMLLAPFTSDQREEQRRMVEVNLLGAMTATEVFLDQFRDGGGDLVNISSFAARIVGPPTTAETRFHRSVVYRPLKPGVWRSPVGTEGANAAGIALNKPNSRRSRERRGNISESPRVPARPTRCRARQAKTLFAGLSRSPLTDSNRRPPPYHVGSVANGRNRAQRLWLI